MDDYLCSWRIRIGDRPPRREYLTVLLAERLGVRHHGFNGLPGEAGVWVEDFEVEAESETAAKAAAEVVGQEIRTALARYDGVGLSVEGLQEVRKLPLE